MLDPAATDGGLARMVRSFNDTGSPTGDLEADTFLRQSATAVLMGILFDQRVRAETAFIGPFKLRSRLGHFDMAKMASIDPALFREVFSRPPAVHRFSNVMADRAQLFAGILRHEYGGFAENIWRGVPDPTVVERRILEIPGFGPGKVKKLSPAMTLFGHVVCP